MAKSDLNTMISECNFYLMHKDIIVISMQIGHDGKIIQYIENKKEVLHQPFGTYSNSTRFKKWWQDRAVPSTRNNARSALTKLGYTSTGNMLVDNLGLSLNDCYWIKPIGSDLKWQDVSLFKNKFEDDFGALTLNKKSTVDLKNKTLFHSAASQGELQKKWCIDKDGRRFMVKGNYGTSFQQSINELFATELHKKQGFKNYVPYYKTLIDVDNQNKAIGCSSYCFCSEEIESISAWDIIESRVKPNHISTFEHFKSICLENGIKEKEFDNYFDYLIMSDFLLSNTDRHMNNIAILRNPDTLKFIGLAPIYDTGNSMFFRSTTTDLKYVNPYKIEITSFAKYETKMLRLVKNRKALDLSKTDMDFSIYEKLGQLDKKRVSELERLFDIKKDILRKFQDGDNPWQRNR